MKTENWTEWYLFACQLQLAALTWVTEQRRKGAHIKLFGKYQVKQLLGRKWEQLDA